MELIDIANQIAYENRMGVEDVIGILGGAMIQFGISAEEAAIYMRNALIKLETDILTKELEKEQPYDYIKKCKVNKKNWNKKRFYD